MFGNLFKPDMSSQMVARKNLEVFSQSFYMFILSAESKFQLFRLVNVMHFKKNAKYCTKNALFLVFYL